MTAVKLQYSLLCEIDEKDSFINIIHGFTPGQAADFYVINKWLWDNEEEQLLPEAGYYQVTSLLRDDNIFVSSRSENFRLKLSHTHHNYFRNIEFMAGCRYRLRVELFDSEGRNYKQAGIEYPLFVR